MMSRMFSVWEFLIGIFIMLNVVWVLSTLRTQRCVVVTQYKNVNTTLFSRGVLKSLLISLRKFRFFTVYSMRSLIF